MSQEEKDRKNKQVGILISVSSHLAVILLFIFLVAWRAPNPPLPEFGIELNFGNSDQGTGEVQPTTNAAESEKNEEAKPDTPPEEVVENPEETVEDTPAEEVNDTTEPVEETTNEVTEEVTAPAEIKPVTANPTSDPVNKPAEKPVEDKKVEEKKETPKPPKVLYPGNKKGAAGTTGNTSNPTNANQGDKTDALGDQGDKEGDLDARALYGNAGGGGGTSLEMAGWQWDFKPDPKENTTESGKIVFLITIDERGEVTSVKPDTYTVSASLMKLYQAEVEKLTFTKTSSGPAPPSSQGKITFLIEAK